MTEQTTWLQTYGWAVAAAAIILAAALLLVIGKRRMTTKHIGETQSGKAGNKSLALDCVMREDAFLEQHRGELLTSLRTSAQRDRLRGVDLRISACWFSADGIQSLLDAMLDAVSAVLASGGDVEHIRRNIINPYVIPVRMKLHGLHRALLEAQEDCYPIPDDADLRTFLQLTAIRPTDTTAVVMQKTADNRRLIDQCLQAHGYEVHYDKLLTALLVVFDGESAHAFDDGKTPDDEACAASLTALAEGVKMLRTTYARP